MKARLHPCSTSLVIVVTYTYGPRTRTRCAHRGSLGSHAKRGITFAFHPLSFDGPERWKGCVGGHEKIVFLLGLSDQPTQGTHKSEREKGTDQSLSLSLSLCPVPCILGGDFQPFVCGFQPLFNFADSRGPYKTYPSIQISAQTPSLWTFQVPAFL